MSKLNVLQSYPPQVPNLKFEWIFKFQTTRGNSFSIKYVLIEWQSRVFSLKSMQTLSPLETTSLDAVPIFCLLFFSVNKTWRCSINKEQSIGKIL